MKNKSIYYVIAMVVIFIWSTTYVSTKVLLKSLTPVEIMFYRYLIAYSILFIAYPKRHKIAGLKEEIFFLSAGIFGGTLYFLTENYALKYSLASNVGLLISTAPILTAVTAHFFTKSEKFNKNLGLGFLVAILGVFLIVFNGRFILRLNPLGDCLAIASALSWSVYSILVKKIGNRYHSVYVTRKIFFYSIVTMLPTLFIADFRWQISVLYSFKVIANLLYLGIFASSLCFLLWSKVIWNLGAVKANNFIYLVPLITMISSVIVLSEKITLFAVFGGLLILAGVYISENGLIKNNK